ncbi:50S ribosomal protein L18 [Candidatus Peregrinibacteria bacterium]|jgi:large subunit ribosomal protein L18|nr:50S ribosomal protein L18 [Candidatus Peregrinibacteria bacterium]MBT4631637.1 50S ribosomal protein L18 [Candidatus Peregrinibacteria bacterium]MBT5823953.1 50S ribosomal protein L18 [Candidatus Peregrinibacteria bacterium]
MKKTVNKEEKRQRRHVRSSSRMSGSASRPRLIVFRSLRFIYAQLLDDKTGKTLASAHDMKVTKGTKVERAEAVGKELGEKAKKAGIETCVFDRNGYKYHGRVKALADGARSAGLKF